MLITDETIEKINLVVQRMFIHNRIWDRALGFMATEWAFDNFNKVFHGGLAHLYPLMADKAADIILRYNIAPKYYETPTDVTNYNTMLDFFDLNVNEHIKTYEYIKDAINVANVNGDLNAETDLKALLRIWNHFMEQAIVLRDKAQIYGEQNKAMFDGFANQFYIMSDVAEELQK